MKIEIAKIVAVESIINSIDNGFLDEDVHNEINACIALAKTIKHPFERHLLLKQLNEMVSERVQWTK